MTVICWVLNREGAYEVSLIGNLENVTFCELARLVYVVGPLIVKEYPLRREATHVINDSAHVRRGHKYVSIA